MSSRAAAPDGHYRGLFSDRSAERITGLLDDAVEKGAKVVIGKKETKKNVIQPIVVEGTNSKMRIYSEEIFGPAMTLNRFKNIEEAIEIANSSDYGLAASVYGSNEAECWAIAQEIESGQVHINGPTVADHPIIPHGGKYTAVNGSCTSSDKSLTTPRFFSQDSRSQATAGSTASRVCASFRPRKRSPSSQCTTSILCNAIRYMSASCSSLLSCMRYDFATHLRGFESYVELAAGADWHEVEP